MLLNLPASPDPTLPALWSVFDRQQVVLIDNSLPGNEASNWSLTGRRFLGELGGRNLFSANLVGAVPAGTTLSPLRPALLDLPRDQAQALVRAAQLNRFTHTHRFCGACAAPLRPHSHDQGSSCPSCGEVYYPRLAPAMMVTVTRGREILLARAPHFAPGVYSALAGFVEPGETLEDCVHRETLEEVGLRLQTPRYIGSQSWPFPHSLMLAFIAEYASGDIVPQAGEIEDANWYDIDALPLIPPSLSIANWLINHTIDELRRRYD
ncbi:NAD(+) diphosphatase [Crenobacter sp. SG2305]|uniref:NAD(+) diphosphatase n=1 Tax=Crenobacter oryzisoli TaxID=3056844 RepID=UPI0025AB2BF5|nr:NAD(+) diphosphatase [Crenobacter sp. SG2305]MDN0082037.1 NAD(+) diphosphatase [Crenobacter sp. SG2305]